jgi:hypothetical protein
MKILSFFVLIFFAFSCTKNISLQYKYPNEVLSDDYGILNELNLTKIKDIGEFNSEPSSIPRWICFESKNFHAQCVNTDYDENLKFVTGDLDLNVKENGKEIHLDFNAVIAKSVCEEHLKTWRKIMTDEKYFCLAANYLATNKMNPNKMTGFFHLLKTKKGCDSWFIGDCK